MMKNTLYRKPAKNSEQRIEKASAQAKNDRQQTKTYFEQYCEDNPWAGQCRIYDV